MTDPINPARQEGIALGLAMAAEFVRGAVSEWLRTKATVGVKMQFGYVADGMIEDVRATILDLATISPHVAAARVLLDMPPNRDGMHVLPNHFRAALEQIAKEDE